MDINIFADGSFTVTSGTDTAIAATHDDFVRCIPAALVSGLGVPLTVDDVHPWSSHTFSGWKITYSSSEDLPADVTRIEPQIDGLILVDIDRTSARHIEALVVTDPTP